jgi:hypothetical protein
MVNMINVSEFKTKQPQMKRMTGKNYVYFIRICLGAYYVLRLYFLSLQTGA